MSGHSKWATTKHKKAKIDSARAVVFQKFSREIIVAAKLGGGDPAGNFRLRTAIDRAKVSGYPNENIKRAIEKGVGAGSSENFEELTYEGYAAGGVAVFVEALTDNRNRTAGDVRSIFTKFKGNLGENGCVGWMFKPLGLISFDKEGIDFDKLFETAVDLGAEDIQEEDDMYKVETTVENFQTVAEGLEKAGFKNAEAELTRVPQNSIDVVEDDVAVNVMRLIDRLEELDDVQNVYANCEIPDEIMQRIEP